MTKRLHSLLLSLASVALLSLSTLASTSVFGSTDAKAQPEVDFYSASATRIDRIQPVRLWWRVRDASRVDIYDGFRNVVIPSLGSENYIEVWPERTSTYTLLVYGISGSLEKTVPITIEFTRIPVPPTPEPPATPDPVLPNIYLSTDPANSGSTVTLKWQVENAVRVDLTDSTGQLNNSNVPLIGSLSVSPTVTTTYTLRAYNTQGRSVERSVTVNVVSRDPEILFFRGNSDYVLAGQPVTLEWRAENAVRASLIGPGIPYGRHDFLPAFSSLTVYPRETGVYVLFAFAADGRYVQAQYTVTVARP
jgi:hypothetical protein